MLALDKATVGHQDRRRLDAVSLVLAAGELVAVVGANGAGKTTLLKAISGQIALDGGEATLEGKPLREWPRRILARRRAVLSQDARITFGFSVYDVVLFGRSPFVERSESDDDHRLVQAILTRMNLTDLAARPCGELSGGEQQRVHIARAIAQSSRAGGGSRGSEPRYLLLDEPTSSLDIKHQHAVLTTLRGLLDTELGLLIVMHDLNLASRYADRVVVMNGGGVVADGLPEDVLRPDILEAAFAASFSITRHPQSDRPLVVSGPDSALANRPALSTTRSNSP